MQGIGGPTPRLILKWNEAVKTTLLVAFHGTKVPFSRIAGVRKDQEIFLDEDPHGPALAEHKAVMLLRQYMCPRNPRHQPLKDCDK